MLYTLTQPLVHLIGRPAAWLWARAVGVHVRWLALAAVFLSGLCTLMDAQEELLALNYKTLLGVAFALAMVVWIANDVDKTPEFEDGHAKAISTDEWFLRSLLLIAAAILPLDVYGAVLGRDDVVVFGEKFVNNPSWWDAIDDIGRVVGLSALFAGNRRARTVWARAAAFARNVGVRWGINSDVADHAPAERDMIDA